MNGMLSWPDEAIISLHWLDAALHVNFRKMYLPIMRPFIDKGDIVVCPWIFFPSQLKQCLVVVFVFNIPPTAKVIWRQGHSLTSHPTDWWSRESNQRPLVYKASGLSTTPQRLLKQCLERKTMSPTVNRVHKHAYPTSNLLIIVSQLYNAEIHQEIACET